LKTTRTIADLNLKPINAGGSSSQCLQVLLALPASVIQLGLLSMLNALPNVGEVTGCEAHEESLSLLADGHYDIALVPADLSDEQMIEVSEASRRQGCKVVVLLRYPSVNILMRPAVRRADGFLLEPELSPDSLSDALQSARRGDIPMPRVLTQQLLSMNGLPATEGVAQVALTRREEQTLALLVEGCSNRQIAQRLAISENGVKRHVANVLAKLNSPNRTTAVSLALRLGLVGRPVEASGLALKP
jgi:two-component system nitrate/nitrite response regulator NarL